MTADLGAALSSADEGEELAEARRGRPRSQQARARVLQATSALLCTTTYESLTVESIAAEAGVGKQTIYRWWKNKAEVVLEAILSGQAELELVPIPHTSDLRADLASWMRGMITEGSDEQTVAMARSLMAAALEGLPATQDLLLETRIWDTGPLINRLRAGVAEGSVSSDVDLTAVTASLLDPLIFHMVIGGHRDPAWGESLIDVVLSGIAR